MDHVRRDSMDSAVSDPSREMESQDEPSNSPQAIPCSIGILGLSQVPSDIPANVCDEMESGQSQA